jgi:hypothetical protein
MKKLIPFLLGIFCAITFAFTANIVDSKGLANVDQERGLYIFIRSKPASDYEFLGKVNMPAIVWNGRPREMMNIAIRRAAKQFPKADGIIIQDESFGKVEAITIKPTN